MLGEQERLQLAQHCHHIGRAAEQARVAMISNSKKQSINRTLTRSDELLCLWRCGYKGYQQGMHLAEFHTTWYVLPGGGVSSVDYNVIDTQ